MNAEKKIMMKRFFMAVVGICLCSVGVSMSKLSAFGVDPFSVLMFGLADTFHTTYQVVFLICCGILAVIAFLLNKKLLGIGTIISLTCAGMVTDLTSKLLKVTIGKPNMTERLVLLLISLLIFSVASALYYTANLGVSPYDAQAITIGEKTPLPFRFSRIMTDIICVAIGYTLGGDLGVGTVILAFFMGPAIQFCKDKISEPMLAGTLFHKNYRTGRHVTVSRA